MPDVPQAALIRAQFKSDDRVVDVQCKPSIVTPLSTPKQVIAKKSYNIVFQSNVFRKSEPNEEPKFGIVNVSEFMSEEEMLVSV